MVILLLCHLVSSPLYNHSILFPWHSLHLVFHWHQLITRPHLVANNAEYPFTQASLEAKIVALEVQITDIKAQEAEISDKLK